MNKVSLKRDNGANRPPVAQKKPTYHLWSIERDDEGRERWYMMQVSASLDETELFRFAPHNQKFVSGEVTVYMVADEKPKYTIKMMQEFLRGWKAGTWVKTTATRTKLPVNMGEVIK